MCNEHQKTISLIGATNYTPFYQAKERAFGSEIINWKITIIEL